jgi:tRNA pseudouridine55 synthase
MGRKRRGKPINGWLIVDKPAGLTSGAVVGKVRKLTGAAKVGHGGTLDPLATGVLPIALGEATKTVSYVLNGTKVYRFTIRWGEARGTDDADGEVTACSTVRPAKDEIKQALGTFTGEIDQVPPIYSAIKVDGQRAYALAYAKKPVNLESRPISIHRFELLDQPDADHATFEVTAGKGAYMRGLARDLACHLGTVGHVAALRRLAAGPFSEEQAIPLDNRGVMGHSAALFENLLPVEAALVDIPALALTEAEAKRLHHGQPISVLPVANRSPIRNVPHGAVVCAMAGNKAVALATITGGEICPLRVLNL